MEIEKILVIGGPIVGIMIGWGLTQWSNIVKLNRENKSNLKLVLFNLLEVHHLIITSDEQQMSKSITEKLIAKFVPGELKEYIPREVINHLHCEFIKSKLFPHLHVKLPKIKQAYEDSIDAIKKVDPILAFRLSGRTEIIDYLNNLGVIVGLPEMKGVEKQINQNLLNNMTPILRNDLLQAYEKDILGVAYQIGILTWFKAKKRIRKRLDNKDTNNRIDNIISSMRPVLEKMNLNQLEMGAIATGIDLNLLKDEVQKKIEKENSGEH